MCVFVCVVYLVYLCTICVCVCVLIIDGIGTSERKKDRANGELASYTRAQVNAVVDAVELTSNEPRNGLQSPRPPFI